MKIKTTMKTNDKNKKNKTNYITIVKLSTKINSKCEK